MVEDEREAEQSPSVTDVAEEGPELEATGEVEEGAGHGSKSHTEPAIDPSEEFRGLREELRLMQLEVAKEKAELQRLREAKQPAGPAGDRPHQVPVTSTQVRETPTPAPGLLPSGSISKCPKYNGTTEWGAFLVQFQAWMRLNQYDQEEYHSLRGDLLGLALEGEAQMFYGGLTDVERADYDLVIRKLEKRYAGDNVKELFKAKLLSGRRRLSDESIPKLRDELWTMARKGYPSLSPEAQEQIAMDALLRSVDHELRLQCIMKECKTLDEAVGIMERYETVQQDQDPRKTISSDQQEENPVVSVLRELCENISGQVGQHSKVLSEIQNSQRRPSRHNVAHDECYLCGQKGHFARDCIKYNERNSRGGDTNSNRGLGNANPPAQD